MADYSGAASTMFAIVAAVFVNMTARNATSTRNATNAHATIAYPAPRYTRRRGVQGGAVLDLTADDDDAEIPMMTPAPGPTSSALANATGVAIDVEDSEATIPDGAAYQDDQDDISDDIADSEPATDADLEAAIRLSRGNFSPTTAAAAANAVPNQVGDDDDDSEATIPDGATYQDDQRDVSADVAESALATDPDFQAAVRLSLGNFSDTAAADNVTADTTDAAAIGAFMDEVDIDDDDDDDADADLDPDVATTSKRKRRRDKPTIASDSAGAGIPTKIRKKMTRTQAIKESPLVRILKQSEDPNFGEDALFPPGISLSMELESASDVAYPNLDIGNCGDEWKLTGDQISHVRNLMKVLMYYPFALDFSAMGTGKTLAASVLARSFDFVLVVCPLAVVSNWESHIRACGAPKTKDGYCVITWQRLCLPESDLIESTDQPVPPKPTDHPDGEVIDMKQTTDAVAQEVVERGTEPNMAKTESAKPRKRRLRKGTVRYVPTKSWQRVCATSRTLVILDEAHTLKNRHSWHHTSCRALLNPIMRSERSKVLLLSATICDKPKHAITFMDTLDIFSSRPGPGQAYDDTPLATSTLDLGIDDKRIATRNMLDWASANGGGHYDRAAISDRFVENCNDAAAKKKRPTCMDVVWCDIILRRFSAWMRQPEYENKQLRITGYFAMETSEQRDTLKLHSDRMHSMLRSARRNAKFDDIANGVEFAKIWSAYEKAKIPLFVRLAKTLLMSDEKAQVIISITRKESLAEILSVPELKDLAVGLDGGTKPDERHDRIKAFNADTSDVRLLVGTSYVISQGISLDDTRGDRPRTILTMPTFEAIELTQLMGRTLRMNTKSDSSFVVLFEESVERQSSLITNMDRKAQVLKDPVKEDLARPFLADLRRWTESVDGMLPSQPPVHLADTLSRAFDQS
jgi:hypothetical protein